MVQVETLIPDGTARPRPDVSVGGGGPSGKVLQHPGATATSGTHEARDSAFIRMVAGINPRVDRAGANSFPRFE